jgi:hypothetical protein
MVSRLNGYIIINTRKTLNSRVPRRHIGQAHANELEPSNQGICPLHLCIGKVSEVRARGESKKGAECISEAVSGK